ncbi:hypothetical protein E4U43_004566 [Claviceps pusilla]|uniref:Uncharacterized protein n=1 Tax=Claviceps pusilla TaxID=123648 RepID=A0A9P7N421_9HYPO|nr:hypothetical protein E4U43_004566 [Claviceps pusilla]
MPDSDSDPNPSDDPFVTADPHVLDTLPSLSTLLTSLKRSTLSIHNRLTSIHSDAQFVLRAASSGSCSSRPLVANERCGSWYLPPAHKRASAYFKSTDGHERAWKFSTRRLNMHLVDMIEENDGWVEEMGMPDALSTTIPIWCTVLNRVLLPAHPLSAQLFLPPHLPPSTHAQITALIPSFVQSLRELKLSSLPVLTKPLRPLWITQDSTLLPAPSSSSSDDDDNENQHKQHQGIIFHDFRPVICLTASRRVLGSETDSQGYIQGAADDTENWACGLTAPLFWDNVETLLSAADADLPDLIASLIRKDKADRETDTESRTQERVQLTPVISVCPLPLPPPLQTSTRCTHDDDDDDDNAVIACHIALTEAVTPRDTWVQASNYMHVGLGKHKTASRNLRLALPDICAFVSAFLQEGHASGQDARRRVVVACESGRDTSVGTALALSCYLFDQQGQFRVPDASLGFTKSYVKVKLGSIMTAYPAGNPSRQTLQSVNSFLMDWTR